MPKTKGTNVVLIGTRKGAFILRGNGSRRKWKLDGPHFLGQIIYHLVLDPRDRKTLLMASSTGHLGPTLFKSTDRGKSWKEATAPPAFPKARSAKTKRAVNHVFWLTPGHADQPGTWYAGTSPPGLFRSTDGGMTWKGIDGFNTRLIGKIRKMIGPVPGGPITHSILVDPRDPDHLYAGVSSGGSFESLDAGRRWTPLNKGVAADFLPGDPEYGHDPHIMTLHPLQPDRLYQQNHCGIYRLDRPATKWRRIGKNMPSSVGDIGFPIVLHPRDPDTAWVIPMDGTTVWPRTSVGGKPAVYRTSNGGKTWKRQDKGLPRRDAWLTTKRQAFSADERDTVGLYFGTTSGSIWMSPDEGKSWREIASNLPEIYSVVAASFR